MFFQKAVEAAYTLDQSAVVGSFRKNGYLCKRD